MSRITRWDDACEQLSTRFEVASRGVERADVTVVHRSGEVHTVALRAHVHDNVSWLEISTKIELPPQAVPTAMLATNANLAIGGLAIDAEGMLRVRHNILLEGSRVDDLEDAVAAIVQIRCQLQRGGRG